jgi:hypothetical protein
MCAIPKAVLLGRQRKAAEPFPGLEEALRRLVKEHALAVEKLTEVQLVEVIRQALECGDLMRHVEVDTSKQCVSYVPYRRLQEVQARYHELLYAVVRKWPGESAHETALRYIREAEMHTTSTG